MLTPDTQVLPADGTSLAFVAVQITDRAGVLVPSASNLIQFSVDGPAVLAGVDNGHQENPQSYQASSVPAFNGRALVIVQSAPQGGHRPDRPGTRWHDDRITVTATSPGLRGAQVTLGSAGPPRGRGRAVTAAAALASGPAASRPDPQAPTADASYSGAPGTVPAAMLDGNLATGWSNYYDKAQTANLRAVSVSNPSDWVALSWPQPQSFDSAVAYFTTGAALALPATIAVSYWDGREFVPVRNLAIDWATASNQPTTLTFDPVRSSQLRLDHDQRRAGHRRRFPDDRRAPGAQQRAKNSLGRGRSRQATVPAGDLRDTPRSDHGSAPAGWCQRGLRLAAQTGSAVVHLEPERRAAQDALLRAAVDLHRADLGVGAVELVARARTSGRRAEERVGAARRGQRDRRDRGAQPRVGRPGRELNGSTLFYVLLCYGGPGGHS